MNRPLCLSLTFLLCSTTLNAYAAENQNKQAVQNLTRQIEAESKKINAQKQVLDAQYEKLQQQEQRLQAIQIQAHRQFGAPITANKLESFRGAGTAGGKQKTDVNETAKEDETRGGTETVGTERKPKEKDHPPQVAAIADEGGVLLSKGTLVIEPSVEYTRSSAIRVAIEGFTIIPALNIGSFTIDQVDRDTITSAVTARYGITNRIEVEARVPYVYRDDSTLSRPVGTGTGTDILQDASGDDIGDIELAAHYQINRGLNGWPFLVGNLRFKTRTGTDPFEVDVDPVTGLQTELPTGSGFYALQPSITAIIPSDPAVIYANVGYLYNIKRDVGGTIGDIDPGDSIDLSFGMGFSMNERTSFSVGYSHDVVFETEQNGVKLANSDTLQVGSLNLGYAYRATDNVNVNLNVDAGLTDDAPDASIMLRVPIAFNLLK